MSIRTIRRAGEIVAYQALAGAGHKGTTEHFSVAEHGLDQALALASERSLQLAAAHPKKPRPAMLGNAGGIPGLQLVYQASRREGDPPTLYARATWRHGGKNVKRNYSTQLHGKSEAVAMAMAARERGAGVALGMTAAQALAVLEAVL